MARTRYKGWRQGIGSTKPSGRVLGPPKARRRASKGLPKPLSEPEELLALQLRAEGIDYRREVRAVPYRGWRLDFVLGDHGPLAVEIQGWGRHQRFKGYEADCIKLNECLLAGWSVLLVTPAQVKSGLALQWIKRALGR